MPCLFFRDDDPDLFQRGDQRQVLYDLVDVFVDEGVPITLAVIPETVTEETVRYVNQHMPTGLIDIIQHGLRHARYRAGEFDSSRSEVVQKKDIEHGWNRLASLFGEANVHRVFCAPYGVYTGGTYRALERLGFEGVSSSVSCKPARLLISRVGRVLRTWFLAGRRIPYHPHTIPGTQLLEVSTAVNVLRPGGGCKSPTEIVAAARRCRTTAGDVVGVLLHHVHMSREDIGTCRELLRMAREEGWRVCALREFYEKRRNTQAPGQAQ